MEKTVSQSRKYLETAVAAFHKDRKESIPSMDNISLLRLAHPADASYAAFKLYQEGEITKEEASEFCTIVGSGYKEKKV